MWDGIEQLKSQHEALDFQSAIDVQEEEIEHLTIGDTSPEIHQLDPEVITALRHDVEDQRRVIEDKEIARRMQGFDHFVLQSYADEEFAIETQEDFERLRLQEQSDREYAMTLRNRVESGRSDIPEGYQVGQELRMNPLNFRIRYTQDSIRSDFRLGGMSIHETKEELEREGQRCVNRIPAIKVFHDKNLWWSADNRRLWCFKEAGIDCIPVLIVEKRMVNRNKFTSQNEGKYVRVL